MTIKLLSQNLINQIAAGEVIERPASVIKELMENAIDAEATEIEVKITDAGKNFLSVSDNGHGMDKESLELCILSHATSKLKSENLFDIQTFGFRGEALPSIASVSRLSITSVPYSEVDKSAEAWSIKLEGSKILELSPAIRKVGTTIEVRDLFFATPARLKFLKSDFAESDNCRDVFDRIALAFNKISFRFIESGKEKYCYNRTDDLLTRIKDVLGESFTDNTFAINCQKDDLKLYGFVGVPTFNKSSAGYQYFFVNNRFVKDKIFAYALKFAYAGLVPQGRYAVAVLFLEIPYDAVDVNAHPSKIEIRFRESEKIRHFIVSELKKALFSFGANRPTSDALVDFPTRTITPTRSSRFVANSAQKYILNIGEQKEETPISSWKHKNISNNEPPISPLKQPNNEDIYEKISLGEALCQINNTYIVAFNENHLIIIDQHAAAERITLEKLKNNLSLDSQVLLLPEVCTMTEFKVQLLEKNIELLRKFGIYHDKLAPDLIVVNSIPAILETCDAKSLISDVTDELSTFDDTHSVEERINRVLSTISCHGSLRAGKKLTLEKMNSLLRQMENSHNIAQCCHGRPSYIKLSVKILEKLFERS
ncbi:MAG: DNA mismatch repair endonuclease MutL [Holosporaceae bacterium]|jgi:DNA mismatch repair protein MutL|nr:DNA mismatch repair endonuclease MutL [Holosporaceae bacterium]